ncbi:hypothetical protein [Ottowia sp.]|uniref:hypothetical protein n=1 Tax=Ottowia sp. TaxID=1898956 RepID=UPI002622640E|nr:hypothetical protein [Ottowia sp.]
MQDLSSARLAELEADVHKGELSWRELGAKYGVAQTSIRDHCKRRGITKGVAPHQKEFDAAMGDDASDEATMEQDAGLAAYAARAALKLVSAELQATVVTRQHGLDARRIKTLSECVALNLNTLIAARTAGTPVAMEGLSNAELEALAKGRR